MGLNVVAGVTATLEGTLWHNNDQDTGGSGAVVIGTVDWHGDPAFVGPAAGDYHLQAGSPAIDAGVRSAVDEDIDGDSRPRGRTYDIGADEYPDPVAAPESVVIAGPDIGLIASAYVFTATVSPTNTTLPDYVWAPAPESGQGTRYATYAWSTGGAKPLSVTVSNDVGSVEASTTVTIMPEITFTPPPAYSVPEEGTAVITVSLTAPSDLPIRVDYATADGTVTAGEDYAASSGTLSFAPDMTLRAFDVPIASDAIVEDDETVRLTLSSVHNAVLGTTGQATLTIRDRGETYIYLPLVLRR
ncbi:MAG: Calx-beta domain-containing protein [Anaerolineae bacterium]